jgi:tetratricopeptide (TPR) repeat protein
LLFDEARQLMRKLEFDEACARFDESQALDPAMGTLLNLAACREKQGRLASALRAYEAVINAARLANDSSRENIAMARHRELLPKVSTLRIELPLEAKPFEFTVRLDERELSVLNLAEPIRLDKGPHTLVVQQPNHVPYQEGFELAPSGENRVISIHLIKVTQEQPAAERTLPLPREAAESRFPSRIATSARRKNDFAVTSLVLAGLSLGAVAIGSYYGMSAYSKNRRSNEEGCDRNNECTAHALVTRQRAIGAGNSATIAYVASGILAASSLGLYGWGAARADSSNLRAALGPSFQVHFNGAF